MRPDRSASNRAILAVVMAGALLAGAAVPPARADVPAGRLPTDVIPTFQSVDLTLDADSADYSGSVRVELRVSRATDAIRFHAKDMDLHRVALRGPKGEVALTPTVGDQAIVTATAGGPIAPGSYTLTVEFSNDFDRRAAGLYRLRTGGHWYAFTQLEAIDARKAFPCWDEPSFKFPYQITLHVPERHRAVSNTPVERETVADGVRTVVFKRTKPLPSYLLAIATGPFEFVPIPGLRVPGRIVTVQGASALAQVAVKMTPPLFDALESYFGIPYPYEKLDLIAVPEFSPGAMENPGAITYGDRFLLFDERTMSVEQRRTLATFTAHEISHMWFGDLVTMKWWDDLWLNESFAEWMGDKIAGQVYPDLAVGPNALLEGQQAYAIDALLSTRAIRQPVTNMENLLEAADVLAYRKGQIVLGMIERWLGPEVFRKGIVSYLKAHAWGNAEGRDLWNALAKASGKDVPGVLGSFLDQPGVPMVDVAVDPAGRVTLSQQRFLHYGTTAPDSALWKIPVSLSWPDGGTRRTETVVLDRRRMTVALPRGAGPAWVHPNVEEAGYYRWSLDAASFRGLIAAAPRALDTRERIGVIENASALLDAGAIHGDQYVEILGGFADDESPLVVSSLFGGLGLVKNAFVTPDLEDPFASFVRRTLTPALRRFGIARRPNEDEAVSLLRPQLINWLADDGRDAAVLAVADSLARSFLNDRGSVDPSLVGTALLTTAIHGDSTLFGEFRRRFETTEVPTDRPDYLSALGNFHDPALRKDALDYALHGPLRPHELFTIPSVMAGTPEFRDETWAWWMENYDSVTSRMPPEYAVYVPYMAGGCDAARLEQAKTFFADPKHAPPGTLKELAKLSESVGDCVGLRGREGAAVARLLRESARMP